ncbi:hypothetical protein KRX57_07915 [Weeksellaceae bacterium TAE3-ERU29]|nr:hypothetical protein [Weeksellaceae bacterium TAE3-ERU29]
MDTLENKYYREIREYLIGKKVQEVYYEELDYQSENEFWEYSDEIHSIDMNVIFKLDNNDLIQIFWDNTFHCYGIGLKKLSQINSHKELIKTINLSNHQNWRKLIGKKIEEIVVFWEFVYENESTKLPQTWEIKFKDEVIWISAMEFVKNDIEMYWKDHLTLFFTNNSQKEYKLTKRSDIQSKIS